MKKYLIRLADHLDKKGFKREADYIDLVLKKHAELEEYENMTLEELKRIKTAFEEKLSTYGERIENQEYSDTLLEIFNSQLEKIQKVDNAIKAKQTEGQPTNEEGQLEIQTFEEIKETTRQTDADIIFREINLDKIAVNGVNSATEIPYDVRADMVFEAIESLIQQKQTYSEIKNDIQNDLTFIVFKEGATSFVARDAIEKGWIVESEKDPGYYKIFSYEM